MKRAGIILLIILMPILLFSEDFGYGTSEILSLIDSETLKKSINSFDGLYYEGCSLLETLPLMEDVYEMEIISDGSKIHLKEDDLGEYWAEAVLVNEENSTELSLIFKDIIYQDLTQLNFKGTLMESDELEVWLSWEGIDALKDEIENFAKHHNIKIKAIELPSPDSKLQSIVRARGDVPDLVMIQSSAVDKLVSARAIQNLGYIKTPELITQGTEAYTLNNKLWALPFYFDTQVVYYNKNLIRTAPSPDWSLKEMERIARDVKNRNSNIHPLAWNAYSSNWLIPFQVSFGKESLIDSQGYITVNDSATEDALDYILNLKKDGLLSPLERDAMDALFIAGKVGMIMSGSYAVPYFESLDLNFGVLPYPINQETGIPLSPLLDFKAFCITKQTKHPILARRFLQHMVGAGVQQRFCPALAKLPARTDVLNIPGISYGYLKLLKSTVEQGTVIPPSQVYSIYKNNMWKLLRFALSGQMSVHQTLEKGQTLMNNTMKN